MAKPMKTLTFRELYKQLVYIEDKNSFNIMKMGYQIETTGDETGVLAYGYIDEENGVCFNIFSLVKVEDDKIVSFNDEPMKRKINHRVRLEDVYNLEGMALNLDPDVLMNYVDRAVEINKEHFVSETKEAIRYNEQIDIFRNFIYPDDVECFVYDAKENKIEALWARTEELTSTGIIAKVLTPVSKMFGYAVGDEIQLNLYKYGDSVRLINMIKHD